MSTKDNTELRFYRMPVNFYGGPDKDNILEPVCISLCQENGFIIDEIEFIFNDLGCGIILCSLEVPHTSWKALTSDFNDILQFISDIDIKGITPDEFCEGLLELGIKDCTPVNYEYGNEK